jgi:hypothetical protein
MEPAARSTAVAEAHAVPQLASAARACYIVVRVVKDNLESVALQPSDGLQVAMVAGRPCSTNISVALYFSIRTSKALWFLYEVYLL